MHFKVIVEDFPPYIKVSKDNDRVISIDGPMADLLNLLAFSLNFTYSLCASVDSSWGSRKKNGTWTGMIGMLEADIAVGPFSLTYERWAATRTSVPIFMDYVKILSRSKQWKLSLFSVLEVFSWEVWSSLFLSCIGVVFILCANDKLLGKQKKINFLSHVWSLIRILLHQDDPLRLKGKIVHLLNLFWRFFVMLVTIHLSSELLTTMTLQKVNNVDTLEELMDDVTSTPIIEKGSSMVNYLQDSKFLVHQQIFSKALQQDNMMSIKDMGTLGMDLVSLGSVVLLSDFLPIKAFLSERYKSGKTCNFYLSDRYFRAQWKVMAFNPRFPDNSLRGINAILLRQFECDWLKNELEENSNDYAKCLVTYTTKLHSLTLNDLKAAFGTAIIAFVTSIFVLLLECFFFKVHKLRQTYLL